MMQTSYSYLALGDSYTIGESVLLHRSFPYQAVALVRAAGHPMSAPEIIARTGWTTDELAEGMKGHTFLPAYDFVSLLIGVNNQYRGKPVDDYAKDFRVLLGRAIELAGGKKKRTFVLSIPDYSVTPFGAAMDPQKIRRELDEFNRINREITLQQGIQYIDITPGSRAAAGDKKLLAMDELHPSEKEYAKWADKLAAAMLKAL